MKRITDILTDEELEKIIEEASMSPVKAPGGIKDSVLSSIRPRRRGLTVSFPRYCARVSLSVAAALAFLFLSTLPAAGFIRPPEASALWERREASFGEKITKENTYLSGGGVFTEALDRFMIIFERKEDTE